MPMSESSVASTPMSFSTCARTAAPSLRLSLSALVSTISRLTSPAVTRSETNSSSCLSRSVRPSRESTISTTPDSDSRWLR